MSQDVIERLERDPEWRRRLRECAAAERRARSSLEEMLAQLKAQQDAIDADARRFRWLVDHSPSDLGEASDIRAAFDRVMARKGGA